jgi:hypothetical protein
MSQNIIQFTASPEVVRLAKSVADKQQLGSSEPVPLESPVDTLDSPINPDDIHQVLELIKIAFETGTAAVAFFSGLKAVWPKDSEATVANDRATGKPVKVHSQSDPTEIVSELSLGSGND